MPDGPEIQSSYVTPIHAERILETTAREVLAIAHSATEHVDVDDPEKIAELTTHLSLAASHLIKSAGLINDLPPEIQVRLLQSLEPVDLPPRDVGQSAATGNLATGTGSAPPAASPAANGEVAPTDAADTDQDLDHETIDDDDFKLELDPKITEEANERARAKYGHKVRTVTILNNRTLGIDGAVVAIFSKKGNHIHTQGRAKILNLLLSTREDPIGPNEIIEASGIAIVSSAFATLSDRLVDASGASILQKNKINLRRASYQMSPDIVIVDQRPASNVGSATASESDAGGTDDAPKGEGSEHSGNYLDPDTITIDGLTFDTSQEEHDILSSIIRGDGPISALALQAANIMIGDNQASQLLPEVLDDNLFVLFKRGILTQELKDDGLRYYDINEQVAQTIAGKIAFEAPLGTVYLDPIDLRVLKTLHAKNDVTASDIVHILTGNRELSDDQYRTKQNQVSESLKKYLIMQRLVKKKRGGNNGDVVLWSLQDGVATALEELISASDATNQPAAGSPDNSASEQAAVRTDIDPAKLRRELLLLSDFKAANDRQMELIKTQNLKAFRILLGAGNRVKIDDHEAVVRGSQLELLNHLLLRLGTSVDVLSVWRSGYSLTSGLPLPDESPSAAKKLELFGMLSADADGLNRKFGPFITINRTKRTFGLLDGTYVQDTRELS
ncbi:MAG TPA: hypothetical protein VIH90_07765 [Candidatus Saccharimonadales bacterium]